jgi:outer membrane receptor protein involved in Fe transport
VARQGLPNGTVSSLQNFRSANQDFFNVRAGVEGSDWSATLELKNLTNKQPMLFPITPIAQSAEGVYAVPRTIGITVRKSFSQ